MEATVSNIIRNDLATTNKLRVVESF